MKRLWLMAAAVSGLMAAPAHAVDVRVNVGVPGYHHYAPRPYYVPAPVVYAPAPIYYAPPPRPYYYYAPAPVYRPYRPEYRVDYWGPRREYWSYYK